MYVCFLVWKKLSTYDYIIMQEEKAKREEDVASIASSRRSKKVCTQYIENIKTLLTSNKNYIIMYYTKN